MKAGLVAEGSAACQEKSSLGAAGPFEASVYCCVQAALS